MKYLNFRAKYLFSSILPEIEDKKDASLLILKDETLLEIFNPRD